MSETLLDKSISNYNVAVMIRNQMGSDEAYLNYIGYHLQQAVELNLKYQLEMSGIEYPKTHDIEDHSEMFSLWEARTRYVLNYHLEERKIDVALKGVKELLDKTSDL